MSIVLLHSSLLASVATRGTKRLVDITTLCSIVKVLGVVLSDDIKTAALLYECVIFFIIFKPISQLAYYNIRHFSCIFCINEIIAILLFRKAENAPIPYSS